MDCEDYFEVIPILEILSITDGTIFLEWMFKSKYEKDTVFVAISNLDNFDDYKFQLTKSQLNLLYKLLDTDINTIRVNKSMARPFIQEFHNSPLYDKYIHYCNSYFEIISMLELLSNRHGTILLRLSEEWIFKTNDEKDMILLSLIGTSSIEDYLIKSYKLTKYQLNLLFKLLCMDESHCIFKTDKSKVYKFKINDKHYDIDVFKFEDYYESYCDIKIDKSIPTAILYNFQKSPLHEKYLQYKSEKEFQRQKNLSKYK